MNDGRSSFIEPRPYDSHEPNEGRPAICEPVWKNVIAGSWLIASVYIDLTNADVVGDVAMMRQQLAQPGARLGRAGRI